MLHESSKEVVRDRMHAVVRRWMKEAVTASVAEFRSAIRPIYGSTERGLARHIASCTLLEMRGARLLMTAAHVIDENRHAGLYVAGECGLVAIETEFMTTAKPDGTRDNDRYDFAVAKLPPEMVTALGNVKYVGEANMCTRSPDPTGHLYLALGFPHSANKKVDHVRRVVPNRIWPYAGVATRRDALAKKLCVTGDHHMFIGFDKRSKDFSGVTMTSKDPTGMSGGGLFDLGRVGRPEGAVCKARLTGLLIEVHRTDKAIVATKIGTIIRAISEKQR
jgi:hypothetical protein